MGITYDQPAKTDIRFPQKRFFASFFNKETIFAVLPVPKKQFHIRDRSHYSACGEDATHTMSYSKAPIRSLSSMPRVALNSVGDISGLTVPVQEDKVLKFAGSKGIPLFWQEKKEVDFWVALFKDLAASHVFDIAAGHGAAACASALLDITYEGVAMNEQHATWLDNVLDKVIFTIVNDTPCDDFKEHQPDVKKYFAPLVEEGRKFLCKANVEDAEKDPEDEEDEDED